MPVPKNTKFRFRTISPTERQRLAIHKGEVIEVEGFQKRNNKWVRGYRKKI